MPSAYKVTATTGMAYVGMAYLGVYLGGHLEDVLQLLLVGDSLGLRYVDK